MTADETAPATLPEPQSGEAEKTFDVFLSYHWADRPVVEPIARAMRDREMKVFLDRWYLAPGRAWPQALEEALASCAAVAVFVGPHGMGSWQQREYYLALDRQAKEAEFPVIPVLMPGSDPALGFLSLNTWIDLRAAPNDPVVIEQLIIATKRLPAGEAIPELAICPYRGLRPFREEDATFFFGREAFTRRVVEAVERRSLVAMVGVSGSGKSSVVRAGLVPHLRRGGGGHVWEVAPMVPTDRPLHGLAAALLLRLEPDLGEIERLAEVGRLADAFLSGSLSLRDVIGRVLEKQPGTDRLLLVVDQWEEIYTLCEDAAARERFIEMLLEATRSAPLTVVLTTRADFFDDLLEHRALADALQDGVVSLGPMTREELTQAIEAPAHRVGLAFEPGLVERILNDVASEPGSLPLLEFLLTELWEQRRRGRLVHEAYERMGGAQGAIAQRAEAEFERLTETEQKSLAAVFLQLVRPGEATGDTRRRARLSELGAAALPVVQRLVAARLLVAGLDAGSGEETIEVAHEALIRGWERLQGWLDADREFLLWRQRLRLALEEWERTGLDEGALLRGAPLGEAKRWLDERSADLRRSERSFIEECLRTERRRRRRRRIGVVGVAAAFTLIPGLLLWNVVQRRAATERLWSSAILSRADTEPNRLTAALLLTELQEWAEPPGGLAVARRLVDERAEHVPWAVLASDSGAIQLAAFLSDSVVMATDDRGAVWLWPVEGQGEPTVYRARRKILAVSDDGARLAIQREDGFAIVRPDTGGDSLLVIAAAVRIAAFSPDGRWVLGVSEDGTAGIWSTERRREPVLLPETEGNPVSARFGPDGAQVVITYDGGTARVWQIDDPRAPRLLESGGYARVWSAAIGRDGRVAVASDDGTARIWSAEGEQPELRLAHPGRVRGAAFSFGDSLIVTAASDSAARVWRLDGPDEPVLVLRGHGATVRAAAFSPDDRKVLTVADDGRLRLWKMAGSRPEPVELRDHSQAVWRVAFSPDGSRLASASDDGTARVWQRGAAGGWTAGEPVPHPLPVLGVAFSADGRYLATATEDSVVRLCTADLRSCRPEPVLRGHAGPITAAVFTPQESWVVSAGGDNVVEVRRTNGSGEPVLLGRHGDLVRTALFSPDGKRVLSASEDSTARVWPWDLDRRGAVLRLEHPAAVLRAAFSPDGRKVATATDDHVVRIWSPGVRGEMIPLVLGAHEQWIHSLEFSSGGRSVITSSDDGTARIWRTDGVGAPAVLRTGHRSVLHATFSPDDSLVATASDDGTIRIWMVDWQSLLGYLGGSTTVCLTRDERIRLLGATPKDAREKSERCAAHGRARGQQLLPTVR